MKRNRFGINLDQGVPLLTEDDFDTLYVDCFNKTTEQLISWIKKGRQPLLLGGQIGSGKSTIVAKAIMDASLNPDITLHFDRDSINLDAGDFWGIILTEFIKEALEKGIDLSFCKLPQELGGYRPDQWEVLYYGLHPTEFSMDTYATKISLRKKIVDNAGYIEEIVNEIGKRIEGALKHRLFILASGLDKFQPDSAASFASQSVFQNLLKFKTLYEVNAVRLFARPGSPLDSIERLFIPIAKREAVVEMLSKRMGIYAKPIVKELGVLAEWSGGNPRQAIRLLTHFETAKKNRKLNKLERIALAIHETEKDYFAFAQKPSDQLMKAIMRTEKINSSLFLLPGDKDTARLALYGNWILIDEMLDDISWKAEINPLVKAAFDRSAMPEQPEIKFLEQYAGDADIGVIGTDGQRRVHVADGGKGQEKISFEILYDIINKNIEQPLPTNLSEMFDALSGALLSKDRSDRIIISYKNQDAAKAARNYLFAKANTYEYQRYLHVILEGGANKQPLQKLEEILSQDTDIYSFEFAGEWTKEQLEALDKQRDDFLNYQLLWWIPYGALDKYLPHWIQLRQLFEIYVLEDELLGSISIDEINADLAFINELAENGEDSASNVVTNFKQVLKYLKKVRKGENYG
jgi:hypothetical protein